MATVYPGSDIQALYQARGIVSGNVQGFEYLVRRCANDLVGDARNRSDWQQDVIDRLSLASTIYKSKPGCWRDYFANASRTFHYGNIYEEMEQNTVNQSYKTLSGYRLAINMLIATLNFKESTFLDPQCFCLYPQDMIGQRFTCLSHCHVTQERPVSFEKDMEHYTERWENCNPAPGDPFCSALCTDFGWGLRLDTPGCISRNQEDTALFGNNEVLNLKNITMFFPLNMRRPGAVYQQPIHATDYDNWIITPLPMFCDMGGDSMVKGIKFAFQNPDIPPSLCNWSSCNIMISHDKNGLGGLVEYYDGTDMWDIYWGTKKVLSIGLGNGAKAIVPFNIPNVIDDNIIGAPMRFDDSDAIAPLGRHVGNPVSGHIQEPGVTGHSPDTGCEDDCQQKYFSYDLSLDEPIITDWGKGSPQIKLTLNMDWAQSADNGGWWPYGGCWITPISEDNTSCLWNPGYPNLTFNSHDQVYCTDFAGNGGNMAKLNILIRADPFNEVCNSSKLAIASDCKHWWEIAPGAVQILDKTVDDYGLPPSYDWTAGSLKSD